MPEYRITLNHWLSADHKAAVESAGYVLKEKAEDEEASSNTQYTEIELSAPDEETANRTTADLLGFVQGDQSWDVEEI